MTVLKRAVSWPQNLMWYLRALKEKKIYHRLLSGAFFLPLSVHNFFFHFRSAIHLLVCSWGWECSCVYIYLVIIFFFHLFAGLVFVELPSCIVNIHWRGLFFFVTYLCWKRFTSWPTFAWNFYLIFCLSSLHISRWFWMRWMKMQ